MLPMLSLAAIEDAESFGWCGTSPLDSFAFLDDSEMPFCFKFNNAAIAQDPPYPVFFYFGTRVDIFELVSLQGSNLGEQTTYVGNNTAQWRPNSDVGVQFEAGNLTTKTLYARKYDPETGKLWVFSQLSVVIILEMGRVKEVIWDDGCYACGEDSERCVEGNCAIDADTCGRGGNNHCDFAAYVSWYGTDRNGRYLLTAGDRLSQFSEGSAKSYYNYVRDHLDTDWITFCQLSSNTYNSEIGC